MGKEWGLEADVVGTSTSDKRHIERLRRRIESRTFRKTGGREWRKKVFVLTGEGGNN